jgi:hypothetical protein
MKRFILTLVGALLAASAANATTIDLAEYGVNVNGDLTPPGVNSSGFDFGTGLGSLVITVKGLGAQQVLGFFDHEIDEAINTFFNEEGGTSGSPAAGQSWEIDEPGWVFGDIYSNFVAGTLDNSIGFPGTDDVSMAMGWLFSLKAGETGVVTFVLSTVKPGSGFYLSHFDADSDATIYFYSGLRIFGGGQVPEPGSILLLGIGLLGLASARQFRREASRPR